MLPPVTENVSLHRKSPCKNNARKSGGANNMHPLSGGGGGGAQTEKIPNFFVDYEPHPPPRRVFVPLLPPHSLPPPPHPPLPPPPKSPPSSFPPLSQGRTCPKHQTLIKDCTQILNR